MRSLSAIALSLLAGAAFAQAPAPAPQKASPPATAAPATASAAQPAPAEPSKPLILRLDEIDGPRLSVGASTGEKFTGNELPGIGAGTSPTWKKPSDSAFPKERGVDAY